MPIGPQDADKGTDKVLESVKALTNLIDSRLREEGDRFEINEYVLNKLKIDEPTDRVLKLLEKAYLELGWRKVKFDWCRVERMIGYGEKYIWELQCYFERK